VPHMEFGRVCSLWSWGNSVVGVYAVLCYVVRGRFAAVGVDSIRLCST
jgi:hypothetical protein